MPGLSGNRLDKIKQTYHDRLALYLSDRHIDITVDDMFDTIVYNDPSQDKRYTRWLVETLLNDGYLWEDLQVNFPDEDLSTNLHCNVPITGGEDLRVNLHCENNESDSKVTETLRVFMKHSRKLDTVDRSINRYESIADMWKMVKQYAEDKTGKEIKRDEYDKAMAESEVIIDNNDIRIVVPLTEYASKFHGRGTRWCTAADNNNRFWNYAKHAPLFIITNKNNGEKFQLWKNEYYYQFMDEYDDNVTPLDVKYKWTFFKTFIGYIMELRYIPEHVMTRAICMKYCRTKDDLKYVPEEYKTYEFYLTICERNGCLLEFVPKNMVTYELCKIACRQDGSALRMVSDNFITPEICKIACEENGLALSYVPDMTTDGVSLMTPELCEMAVKHHGWVIEVIPKHLLTPELCKMAVDRNGDILKVIPYDMITPELCKIAVEQHGIFLKHVPEKYITPEICKIACQTHGNAIAYVPSEFKTPELYMLSVTQNSKSLEYVPNELRTPELCKIAVEQNGNMLNLVPKKLITRELCELAVKQNYMAYHFVPFAMRPLMPKNILKKDDIKECYHIPKDIYALEIDNIRNVSM